MLQKFENKSERVKGLTFHPKRPWLLASLHNGTIQLFDYRSRVLVDKFEEHQGPVRGVSFHLTQPLFVSGGDDYKIKVWNYKQRKCLFTLHGHLDYVRTVFFHHESPWIVSASDDQTIRIWNWQSRNCISILTGHNHYVMCAQFHPRDPLLVSASLDQTIRVWDISGIKAKSTKPTPAMMAPGGGKTAGGMVFEELSRQGQDMFNNPDAVVKYVLEGHDRGVNWAAFHPTLPLIVSGADDRQIKIWRMSDTKAWEVDSLRGHHNNVSCVIFHPRQELILSNAEDKSIRIWDIAKRQAITVFKSENDRFWVMAAHPELNIFAAGHDNGFILFKLERERPAYTVSDNLLFYVKDKFIRAFDTTNGNDISIATVRRPTGINVSPKLLAYNPSEKCLLVTFANGNIELISLSPDVGGAGGEGSGDVRSFPGQAAVFVARNRYAILDSPETLLLKNIRNEASKQIAINFKATSLFYAGTAHIILCGPSVVKLFDIQQGTVVAELAVNNVKYAFWSDDMNQVALVAKNTIYLASKKLVQKSVIVETAAIKSGAWDERGVFIYSTLTHLKFALPQGDNGIIKTIEQPLYVVKVSGGTNVICLDRECKARVITVDPAEYQFKLALIKRQYDEVLNMIRKSNLIGQSVISYLRKKGYPEVALMFVKEPKARFELAVECGNLEIALESAKAINRQDYWQSLADEGLKQGNHGIVEFAYQNIKSFDRLSFLYLITGNGEKLVKMQKIAEARSDLASLFHVSLYTGNVEMQFNIYMATGQFGLAYLLARNYGLGQEKLEAALKAAEKTTEAEVDPIAVFPNRLLAPPIPAFRTFESNWPLKNLSRGLFDSVSAGGTNVNDADDENDVEDKKKDSPDDEFMDATHEMDLSGIDVAAVNGGGWDIPGQDDLKIDLDEDLKIELDHELNNDVSNDFNNNSSKSSSSNAASYFYPSTIAGLENLNVSGFLRKTRNPYYHASFGSFEMAMKLLHDELGICAFGPLQGYFMKAYHGSRMVVGSAVSGGAPAVVNLRMGSGRISANSLVNVVCESLDSLERIVALGLQQTTQGRFNEAIELFRSVLQMAPLLTLSDVRDLSKLTETVIPLARDYILALSLEGERKGLSDPVSAKSCELSWLFTMVPSMQPVHLKLALRSAMAIHYKAGNYKSSAMFARRILELDAQDQVSVQARKIIAFAEKRNEDAISLPLIQEITSPESLIIDSVDYSVSSSSAASVLYCGNCGAATVGGKQASVCTVCRIGKYSASGSKSFVQGYVNLVQTE